MTVDNRRRKHRRIIRVDGLIRGQRHHHHRRIGLGDRLVKGTCLGPAQRGGRIQNAFGGEVGIAAYRAQPRIMFDRRADLSVSQTFNNGDAMFGVAGRIQSEITIQRANRSI